MNTKNPFHTLDTSENEANNTSTEYILPEEGIEALQELGEVLLSIHKRLLEEGVTIKVDSHYAQPDGSN